LTSSHDTDDTSNPIDENRDVDSGRILNRTVLMPRTGRTPFPTEERDPSSPPELSMETIHLLLWLLVLPSVPSRLLAQSALRQDLIINRDWKLKLGDVPGAERPEFDDASWTPIGLPHSFSTPYFQTKDYYVGYGWYRKHLDVRPDWTSKRVFVEFVGASQDAEVFLNGTRIGEHKGGTPASRWT
jgi:hypothetical protein